MSAILEEMKDITICEPTVTIRSAMNDANLEVMETLCENLRK